MSIGAKNALTLGVHRLELATPHGPTESAQNQQRQRHGERDEDEKDVHGQAASGNVASRAELATTSRELAAMPRPASQGGMAPSMARGTQTAL